MGGPNDQCMSSMWFHFELKILELLTVLARPAAAATSIDPRLTALFTKRSQLVGMSVPMSTLINMLSASNDDMSNRKMKIVCVVGFGGLGKTTLAKRVFDEFKANFCCAAFVSVGRIPDLKKVFKDILINLGHTDSNLMVLDETQLINSVRGFLESKRYGRASLSLFFVQKLYCFTIFDILFV